MQQATRRKPVRLGGARIGAFAVRMGWATIGLGTALLVSRALAQAPAPIAAAALEAARQAYGQGNYRRAAARLNELRASEPQLAAGQRVAYWDLCVDVALASGLIEVAESAADTHLKLLRQAVPGGADEQAALVRLARINARFFPAESRNDLRDANAIARWERVRDLLAAALAIGGGIRANDAVWEAETRLEQARTFEILGQEQQAREGFALASASAVSALAGLDGTHASLEQFLRGVAVVQQSFTAGDMQTERRQAELALDPVEKRLRAANVILPDRVELLVAGARCQRQLRDTAGEARMLSDALATAGDDPAVEPLQRADIMVRLAELADMDLDAAAHQRAITYYHDAAGLYAKVLAEARAGRADATGARRTISVGEQADCLLQLQLIHVRLEAWNKAIAAAEELVELRSRSLLAAGDPNYYRAKSAVGSLHAKAARTALARSADEMPNFSTARESAVKARSHLRDAVAWWRKYRPLAQEELAATLNYYAEALRYSGEFRQAAELLEEARPHFEAAYDATALTMGEFHSNRGAVEAALGMYQPALASYEAAVAVAKSRSPEDKDQRARGQLLALVYLNMAQLFKSQGQYREAREACMLAREAADQWLGSAERAPFQLADAALAIIEAENLIRSVDPSAQSLEDRQLAEQQVRRAQASFANAIATTQAVLADRAEGADPLHVEIARHLQALAHCRWHLLLGPGHGDLDQAQRLWREIAGLPSGGDMRLDILRVRALNSLSSIGLRMAADYRARARQQRDEASAEVLLRQGDAQLAKANEWSRTAEQIAEDIPAYPAVRFQALLSRAQVLWANAQIQQSAAERARTEEKREQAKSSAEDADASTDAAIELLRTAIRLVEMPRAMTTGAEEQRASYFAQFAPGFDLLVDLLVERGLYGEALVEAEKRRSRTFLDQLRISGVEIYETIPEDHQNLVDNARRARDAYYTCLAKLVAESATGADTGALATELTDLQQELVAADGEVRSVSGVYRQLLAAPQAVALNRTSPSSETSSNEVANDWVLRQIGDEDVALVYYVGSEKSYVFECSRRQGIRGTPLRVSAGQAVRLGLPRRAATDGATDFRSLRAEDVAKLVSHVANFVSRPPDEEAARRGADPRIVASAKIRPADLAIITDILVPEPLRKQIVATGYEHLLIVPDGALHQLAFEALPTDARQERFLLDELPPMCYAPSLQIYRQLREPDGSGGEPIAVLSVADPKYRESGGGVRQIAAESLSPLEQDFLHYLGPNLLARLPATKIESDQVRQAFEKLRLPASDIIPLTEENATEGKFKETLRKLAGRDRRVRYLHVAAHGLVDQRYNNLFGALALTPPSDPTAEDDGFLTLYEVMMLPLAGCDLAVLSACETNCGPENALEAGSTMARAFFCAGARRVVSSLWKVSDEATAALVADFMDGVADDLSAERPVDYAAALHQAKLRLRPQGELGRPYFWAPFVLVGTPTGGTLTGRDEDEKQVTVTR